MKIISKFKRISIIEKNGMKFVQLSDEDIPQVLTSKFLEAKNLGIVQGEQLTIDEYRYLLHH